MKRRTVTELRSAWPSWVDVDPETKCWNWNRSLDSGGYGQLGAHALLVDQPIRAHVAAYRLFVWPD